MKIWYQSFVLTSERTKIIDTVQIFFFCHVQWIHVLERKKLLIFLVSYIPLSYLECKINLKKK